MSITSRTVFSARRRYRKQPTFRNLARFRRTWKAYKERFPDRDLCFLSKTVTMKYA